MVALMTVACGGGGAGGGAGGQGGDEPMAGTGGGAAGKQGAAGTDGVAGNGGSSGTRDAGVSTDADGAATTGPYLPVKLGNSWTYKVTDPLKGVSMKTVAIDAFEVPPGGPNVKVMTYRHTTAKGLDKTRGWWAPIALPAGAGIVMANVYERSYKAGTETVTENDWWDPYRNKFDESPAHTAMGAMWTETYKEFVQPAGVAAAVSTSHSESWKVLALDEQVTVPAGTFKCIKVSHSVGATPGTTPDKSFWFARNVGKVKETGGQIEELTAYTVK